MRELVIKISLTETDDWCVEINGHRYDHVSAEIMEGLVEAAVIETEMVLTELATERIQ
jgi:hypothetical protein